MDRDLEGCGPAERRAVEDAWRDRAVPLAAWVLPLLVNRWDVRGGYYVDRDRVRPTTRRGGLTAARLAVHFSAEGAGDVCGAHATAPDETCRFAVVDIDAHAGDGADPEANFRFALHVDLMARRLGLSTLLVDSNGAGGFHVWILFGEPVPAAVAWKLGKYLVRDYAAYGLVRPPETFPKAPRLTGKRIGNWVRLPGRHHKRPHWSRVWDGVRWLEGEEAVGAILAARGGDSDPALVVPGDFDPRPRRPGRRGRLGGRPAPGAATRASGTATATTTQTPNPCPPAREVERARRALAHLGVDYRDDYDAWLRVGLALRQLGDVGLVLWHDWSADSPKYEADVLDAKWEGFGAGGGPDQVALGSLFHWAKKEGWQRRPARSRGGDNRTPWKSRTCFSISLGGTGVAKPEGGQRP